MAAIFQDGRHWRCRNTTFRHQIRLNELILMMLESKCMFLPWTSYIYHLRTKKCIPYLKHNIYANLT